MCINLLLTRITTSEISKIKVNNQKPAPFHRVGVWARFCGGEQHGSAVGSSVAFSSYKRREIKDELLGCVLFSLLWTGCNPSVLEEWKVCGLQKVERASLLSLPPPPHPHRAESVTQQGATICYQRTSSKLFVRSVAPFRRAHLTKAGETIMQLNEQTRQKEKKNHENCWTNKLPFSVSGHLLLLSLRSRFSVHGFLCANVSNTVAQLKGDCFPHNEPRLCSQRLIWTRPWFQLCHSKCPRYFPHGLWWGLWLAKGRLHYCQRGHKLR